MKQNAKFYSILKSVEKLKKNLTKMLGAEKFCIQGQKSKLQFFYHFFMEPNLSFLIKFLSKFCVWGYSSTETLKANSK